MILKNKMEVIRWENSKIPAVILPHPRRASQYIFSHWHRELEIPCLFEGEVSFYNGGVCRTLKSGGVIFPTPEKCIMQCLELHPTMMTMRLPALRS